MLATRDPLTGILLEPVLLEMLAHELAGAPRYGAPSLVVVDLVGYESWVGSRGALLTDLVVRTTGAMLQASSRCSDVLGWLGPGRICLLLPRTDRMRGLVVTRRVQAQCDRISRRDLTLAVGLVHEPAAHGMELVLARVDEVMARALSEPASA